MITRQLLKEIIEDQQEVFKRKGWIDRFAEMPLKSSRIVIVTGIRRCGKSTLLKQKLLPGERGLCINFEDTRLVGFTLEDFQKLEDLFRESSRAYLVLDEVQMVKGWELYARAAHEKGISLFISGSNASMLSRELGTHLTGRYRAIELFPFSYGEYLVHARQERGIGSFEGYFSHGGFPEYLEDQDPGYHRTLLRDIITRDIAVRRNIQNENQLIRLAVHLLSNTGKEFSYNRLAGLLEFKSVRTVIDYCDYLRDSYILDLVPMFAFSYRKQIANPKKAYGVDPAFARSNSTSFSQDLGRRLENMVYNKLRQQHLEIFYLRQQGAECDFLVKEKGRVIMAVQSCWEVNNENMARELAGLRVAREVAGAGKPVIITWDQEDTLDGIPLVPAWKWL